MMNLAEYRRSTTQLADFLPWAALVDEGIVLNKDGSFQRTAKFRGPDLDSAVPAELVGVAHFDPRAFAVIGEILGVSADGAKRIEMVVATEFCGPTQDCVAIDNTVVGEFHFIANDG